MKINFDYSNSFVEKEELLNIQNKVLESYDKLESEESPYTGWLNYPKTISTETMASIINISKEVKNKCDAVVLVGIGGSYLGPKACVEMLSSSFSAYENNGYPALFFAGTNLSGVYHKELLSVLEGKDVCLCVVSKSGSTMEPNIAFSIMKDFMRKKYGSEMNSRIYVVTEENPGVLRKETNEMGYTNIVFPKSIGGRYSVLSPAGLLPIAMAGIDIKEIINGAKDACEEYSDRSMDNICCKYAAIRNILYEKGQIIEVYENYEPKLQSITGWLIQLFGESEGKEGKGVFPTGLQLTTDMHSMGQFLQQGNQVFFETVLNVLNHEIDTLIPETASEDYRGKSMNAINSIATKGIANAHKADSIPNLKIDIPEISPYYFGQLVYFFEKACAISGYTLGVDPFNQPGVEQYKVAVKELLK